MGIMGLNVFSDIHTTMLSPIKLLKLLFPEILRHDMLQHAGTVVRQDPDIVS